MLVIASMRVTEVDSRHLDRLNLEGDAGRAAVATAWHGDDQKWVLTAFDPNWKPPPGETPTPSPINGAPDSARREGNTNMGQNALEDKGARPPPPEGYKLDPP